MQIVNGYVCNCCTEVDLARRGLDPQNPTNDPVKAADEARKAGRFDEAAVILGGSLAGGEAAGTVAPGPRDWRAGNLVDIRA
ncbi:MAG: hypothetical protein ACRCVA_22790 [Phreatobacter sp.]